MAIKKVLGKINLVLQSLPENSSIFNLRNILEGI